MELTTITPANVDHVVKALVHRVPCVDLALHTTESRGIDGLLTAPDLLEELRRAGGTVHATDVEKNANAVWKHLFVHRTPLSESCRRVLTLLNKLGFRDHIHTRNLAGIRESLRAMPGGQWRKQVLQLINLQRGVRAVDVDVRAEAAAPEAAPEAAPPEGGRFSAVVSSAGLTDIDKEDAKNGNNTDAMIPAAVRRCVQRFTRLRQRLHHVRLHLVASEDPPPRGGGAFAAAARAAAEHAVPLWVVLDARHAAVPAALLEHRACVQTPLWFSWPGARSEWIHTVLQAYPGAVAVNVDTHSTESYAFTRAALECWGSNFVAYASPQLRVLEHVASGWYHARAMLARTLAERYRCLLYAGWSLASSEIVEDVNHILGGALAGLEMESNNVEEDDSASAGEEEVAA